MKYYATLIVLVLLALSTFAYQRNVTPEGAVDSTVIHLGFPLPVLEMNTTVQGNMSVTTYTIMWDGLLVNLAVYGVIVLLIFA